MEGYPAFHDLKYRSTRSQRKKVLSVSSCEQSDGNKQHENVAMVYTHILCFVINNNADFLGRKILKDSNFEIS